MRHDKSSQMKHSEHDELFALKRMLWLLHRDNQVRVLIHLSFGQKLIGKVTGTMWMDNGCTACHKISFALTTNRQEPPEFLTDPSRVTTQSAEHSWDLTISALLTCLEFTIFFKYISKRTAGVRGQTASPLLNGAATH